ncbi:50S ribosomal protein L3, partial [Candidatus Kuenenbacteria bacterium]|nr:50S ribosomal protein L3 [Candidatus Kuenenbacteria bacterium]
MKFILGNKIEMTQKFLEDGRVVPVTRVTAGPCFVSRKKDVEDKDGYRAVQVCYSNDKKVVGKPMSGFFKKVFKKDMNFRHLKEFRLTDTDPMFEKIKVGDELNASIFEVGDIVKVQGTSKGKGFQGVVRRHGFSGGPASHGHKDQSRMPGS